MAKSSNKTTRYVETREENRNHAKGRRGDETRGFYFRIIAHVTACLNTKNIKFHSFKRDVKKD